MSDQIRVQLSFGSLEGVRSESGVLVFKNIPFASAKRWQAPGPVESFDCSARDPQSYGPAPIQPPPDPFWAKRSGELTEFPTDEDCLNLNIWVGDLDTPKKSVLFWIYGGSYIQGYNYKRGYLPENFVKAHPEVLVVAPNYRVGVLGSLNLSSLTNQEEYRFSNNLALLDLVEALRWTQRHISAFTGDPENVTLYGHSAGSNAISHLLVMPSARGLFTRAIAQSSYMTDLGTVALDTSEEIGKKVFELTGVHTLEEALALPAGQLLEAQKALFHFKFGGSKASKMFSPVADGIIVMPDAFQCFADGRINVRELMIGGSQGEYDQMFLKKDLEESRRFVVERNADKRVTLEDVQRFVALHPEMTEKEAVMTVHNDLGLCLGGEFIGRACAKHIPVYEYVFCLRDPEEGWRALHGAPCNYVFGTVIPKGAPEQLERKMMDTWAAFIRTGDPNHPGIPVWPRYRPDGPVMMIDAQWRLTDGYWKTDFSFWGPRFTEYALLQEGR